MRASNIFGRVVAGSLATVGWWPLPGVAAGFARAAWAVAWVSLALAAGEKASNSRALAQAPAGTGAAATAVANSGAKASGADAPALPLATRQNVFSIPFALQTGADAQTVEVQLYVSADQGASWQISSRQPPSATQFPFRAARDGEYWFAVRTIDRRGELKPAGTPTPELRVLVDTVAPQLSLTAEVGGSGEIQVRWQARDSQLAPSTFRLEAQTGAQWETVAVDTSSQVETRGQWEGKTQFVPKMGARLLNLRAQVQDRAGNSVVTTRQLFLPRGSGELAAEASGDQVAAQAPAAATKSAAPAASAAARPVDPFLAAQTVSGPAASSAQAPAAAEKKLPAAGGAPQPPPAVPPFVRETSTSLDSDTGATSNPPPQSADILELPPGSRPRMTAAKRFQLDYEIDAVGPSGVSKVELWGTPDGGRSWKLLGMDGDRKSPVDVEVDTEGVFGFQIIVEAGNGLSGKRPQSGDPADIWVGVDTTAPLCRLSGAAYGQGDQAGQLDIRWEYGDKFPGDRPITLSYSEQASGPWTPLAAGLPHSGQYLWKVDPHVPRQVYLRIEARDEAGNTAWHDLAEPIALSGLAPRGRIRAFFPNETPAP